MSNGHYLKRMTHNEGTQARKGVFFSDTCSHAGSVTKTRRPRSCWPVSNSFSISFALIVTACEILVLQTGVVIYADKTPVECIGKAPKLNARVHQMILDLKRTG